MTTSRSKATSRANSPTPATPAPPATAAPIRLSDAALLLLGQAAAREDRLLLPPPPVLRARGSALQKVLQALLKAGLVTEVPVATEAQSWRSDDAGASVPTLAERLAWQNHTVRAALTGLRHKGHQLARTKDADGTTVYRITGLAGADAAGATGAAATIGA